MAFLYFFPGMEPEQIKRDWLRESPIADQMRDIWERGEGFRLLHKGKVNNGPGGQSGTIVAAITDDQQSALFSRDHQAWHDCGTHWIGVDSRFPPKAVSLERRKLVDGIDTELAAGGVWHLPIIRRPSAENPRFPVCCIPTVVTGGASGPSHKIPERFQHIWQLTHRLFAWMYGGVPLDDSKANSAAIIQEAAAACLGVNYRVSLQELMLLECLEDEDIVAIVRAAIAADEVDGIIQQAAA